MSVTNHRELSLRENSRLPPTDVDAFLVWPRGGNTGDKLIVDACERYLRQRGIDVWRSDGSLEDAAIAGDTEYLSAALSCFRGMLFFSGGGNVGIYSDNGAIRAAVLAHASRQHRCLVFSQSAFQPERALIDPRVTVWCRDSISFSILQQAGTRSELVPDMALYMDDTIEKHPGGEGTVFIRRVPGQDAESIDHGITFACSARDLTLRTPLDDVIAALKPYDVVISDRLHGGLIALMMRKKVVLLPVGYHKTRSFYDTWLSSATGVTYVDTQDDLRPRMDALRMPNCDLRRLVCRFADPALDRFLMGH
jgi:exopolysaccharide biosynthesis predicted pyruvyltransferase EpsI